MTGSKQESGSSEEFGGERQRMSPLEALLLYGDQDVLESLEARRQGRPLARVKIWDEEDGEEIEIDSITLDVDGLVIDRAALHEEFALALHGSGDFRSSAQDIKLRQAIRLCADVLYNKLAQGILLAAGIPLGERLQQLIGCAEWNSRLRLDFSNRRAVIDGSVVYQQVEIRDPAFRLSDTGQRRGPKGRKLEQAFKLYKELLAAGESMSANRAWCAHLKRELERRNPGEKWNIKTLESNFSIWKRELATKE